MTRVQEKPSEDTREYALIIRIGEIIQNRKNHRHERIYINITLSFYDSASSLRRFFHHRARPLVGLGLFRIIEY